MFSHIYQFAQSIGIDADAAVLAYERIRTPVVVTLDDHGGFTLSIDEHTYWLPTSPYNSAAASPGLFRLGADTVHRVVPSKKSKKLDGEKQKLFVELLNDAKDKVGGPAIDFPTGYRQLAPFESIVQFCGRINRHGHNPGLSPAYVFENPDYRLRDIHYTIGSQEVRNLINQFGGMDIYGKRFRDAYYRQIDLNTNNTRKLKQNEDDRMNIVWENSLNAARRFLSFRAVGQTYRLISDFSTSVVAYRKGELPAVRAALAAILDWNKKQSDKESDWQFIRSHQISMHQAQVENLIKKGHNQIEEVFDGYSGLYLYHGEYSELLGVSLADIGAE